jgi:hypothetical protein
MQHAPQTTIAGLLALCAFLGGALVGTSGGGLPVARAETSGSSPNMIAVTGLIGSGVSVLYVIDTEKKQLAVYNAAGGKEIRFVAARRIKYDLELKQWKDGSDPRVTVDILRKAWEAEKGAQETGGSDGKGKKK